MAKLLRHMKGCLIPIGLLFLVILVILGIADYLNIPLLPVDLLNRMGSVEIRCHINSMDEILMAELVKQADGITIEVFSDGKQPSKRGSEPVYKTDLNGQLKLFLPRGKYLIKPYFQVIQNTRLIKYQSHDPEGMTPLVIHDQFTVLEAPLYPVQESDSSQLMGAISELIRAGKLEDSYNLIKTTLENGALLSQSDDATLKTKLEEIQKLLTPILETLKIIDSLPLNAYNSKIALYEEVQQYLAQLLSTIPVHELQLVWNGEIVNLSFRIQVLSEIREKIIREHLQNLTRFSEVKEFESALEQWIALTENTELFQTRELLSQGVASEFTTVETTLLPKIKEKVKTDLLAKLNAAKQQYEDGEIDEAWKNLGLVKRRIGFFEKFLELQPKSQLKQSPSQEIADYMEDIMTITQANRAFSAYDYATALELYRRLHHPSETILARTRSLEALSP